MSAAVQSRLHPVVQLCCLGGLDGEATSFEFFQERGVGAPLARYARALRASQRDARARKCGRAPASSDRDRGRGAASLAADKHPVLFPGTAPTEGSVIPMRPVKLVDPFRGHRTGCGLICLCPVKTQAPSVAVCRFPRCTRSSAVQGLRALRARGQQQGL